MCSYHWRRNITLFKWYMWSIFICEMWMYLYEEQETCQNTYIYYICVFPPAAGETPDTWTTQTQLPWQRQTSQISVTSLQTQSLTQTVCASLILKFIKKKNINFSAACHVWRRQTDIFPLGSFHSALTQILCRFIFPPGGADLQRGEGTLVFGWNPWNEVIFKYF